MPNHPPLHNLDALTDRVEAHRQNMAARLGPLLRCRLGCTGCCATEREVSPVELARLQRGWDRLPPPIQAQLAERTTDTCPLLLEGGCALYEDRPLICRSHGLPLLMEGQRDICPLNLEGLDLEALPPEALLSVDTLTTILVAVNMQFCQHMGVDPAQRFPVSTLWRERSQPSLDPDGSDGAV